MFDTQEAREAVLGGARIVDSEDPRSALGNIKPQAIMDISDAVLNYTRDQEVQLSTNIGEDQLLFRRTDSGHAVEKSPYEIAGKAAQAALGVAVSMGTRVHPCNIVKVGLDGMHLPILKEVLTEVVRTLNRTEQFSHSQVMSVLFVQDLPLWRERKNNPLVVRELVSLREFSPTMAAGPVEGTVDLPDYYRYLTGPDGKPLFDHRPSLQELIDAGVLPPWTDTIRVKINDPFPHSQFGLTPAERTDREAIKKMVDATADSGADGIMLDTSILFKVARVSLVDTTEPVGSEGPGIVDFNRFDITGTGDEALVRKGILSVEDIRFFVDYCHYRGVEANLAGSLQSYQAQQIWRLVPRTDQVSTRGGASAILRDPSAPTPKEDQVASRRDQVMMRQLVRGLIPPEQGGYLWLPKKMQGVDGVDKAVGRLQENFPDITEVYWSDEYGRLEPF
ncbi:(5-formylfuran-3-yl)methyl phosphate synthase [Saccharothrix xinjiangensis]|uniref:(5-formylfuran-3-yl)methyl phosphate synthase n=1 Tax=Saccharothrix xinjiangensis TaxID=204798 RepID=A0ABV9XWJ3_9PSEU